jgi:hypothetical protein
MEFGTGRYEAIELNVGAQYNMYLSHARGLEAYAQRAPRRMRAMQAAWYQEAVYVFVHACILRTDISFGRRAFSGIDDQDEAEAPYQDMVPLDDIPPDLPEPDMPAAELPELPELPDLTIEAAQDDTFHVDEDGWQMYSSRDLYGDDEEDAEHPPELEYGPEPEYELEPEYEPEPQPEPEYNDEGRLTMRAKGKGPVQHRRR